MKVHGEGRNRVCERRTWFLVKRAKRKAMKRRPWNSRSEPLGKPRILSPTSEGMKARFDNLGIEAVSLTELRGIGTEPIAERYPGLIRSDHGCGRKCKGALAHRHGDRSSTLKPCTFEPFTVSPTGRPSRRWDSATP